MPNLANHDFPLFIVRFFIQVWAFVKLELELIEIGLNIYFVNQVWVFDKLEVELIEVGLNIYTLLCFIIIVVNEHEVRVDLPATILSYYNTNVVVHFVIIIRIVWDRPVLK